MGSKLFTDAAREIRKTLSRFFSLFLLSALAVAFLAGLRTTAPDMEHSADAYFDQTRLMDVRVLSTLGLTSEDVQVLAAQPGITAAEGSYTIDAIIHSGDQDTIVKVHTLSEQGFNTPVLQSGRMPQAAGECLVEPALLTTAGLTLGDSITLDTGDGDYAEALAADTFTIVGTANSPLYISVERGSSSLGTGRVSAFVLLPMQAFSLDSYTEIYLRAQGADALVCYSDPYEEQIDALIDGLEPLCEQRSSLRREELVSDAQAELDEAKAEYDDAQAQALQELDDAQAELDDAKAQLDDAQTELDDARSELDTGWAEYRDGVDTLARESADAWAQIDQAEQELSDALTELEQGEQEYADGMAEVAQGWLDYAEGEQELHDGWLEYMDGAYEIADAKTELDDGYQELLEGEDEYADGLQALLDGEAEYADGLAQYREGLLEIRANAPALMEAKEELDAAREKLVEAEWALSEGQSQLDQERENFQTGLAGAKAMLALLAPGDFSSEMPDEAFITAVNTLLENPAAIGNITQSLSAARIRLEAQINEITQKLAALSPDDEARPVLEAQLAQLEQTLAQLPADADALTALLTTLADAPGQLDDAQAQLDAGASQIAAGWAEYNAGLAEYNAGLKEFLAGVASAQDAERQLRQARTELDEGWGELLSGRKELDEGWAEYDQGRRDLDAGQEELASGLAELSQGRVELIDARNQLLDAEAELADARQELDDGWAQYRDGAEELAENRASLPGQLADAQAELDDAYAQLLDGEADYADGLAQWQQGLADYRQGLADYRQGKADAEAELADARQQLSDAQQAINDIPEGESYVLGRTANTGYVSFQQDAQRMGNLASVFPVIFFLVAALVCLTTMTRMVEEQRLQIGCLKALGYSKGAIALKYVGYGFLSSLLGGAAGLAMGCTLIPVIIFTAWRVLYTLGQLVIAPAPATYLLCVGAAVLCVTGTAFAACFAALTATPAALMRPKAPPAGKRVLLERIGPLWRRLSFIYKVTVRNLLRYKRRFWMTVIGIGGCTALIVTGFGLRDSIFDMLDMQYSQITTYSANIGLDEDIHQDDLDEIIHTLERDSRIAEWTSSYQVSLSIESDSRTVEGYLFAPTQGETFSDFIHLRHRSDHQPVTLPDSGVVLTEKLADLLGVGPGDTITLAGDQRVQAQVADITENYVFHYVYLSPAAYATLYGQQPQTNTLMAAYTQDTRENADAVAAELIALDGVTAVSRIQDTRATFTRSMESVDYAVVLIIVCAAALAFVVLFNLTNINITERLRELATLKVLGFYDRELAAYVFRENVFLTGFGVLLGLVMGKFLHQWLVLTVEIDMVMFARSARPMSYVYAVVLTILFSLLVNLAARRRLRAIDMVESLKTVE